MSVLWRYLLFSSFVVFATCSTFVRAHTLTRSKTYSCRWDNYALDVDIGDGAKFNKLLEQWYGANVTRFVCALCGWFIVVRLHYIATRITSEQVRVGVRAHAVCRRLVGICCLQTSCS